MFQKEILKSNRGFLLSSIPNIYNSNNKGILLFEHKFRLYFHPDFKLLKLTSLTLTIFLTDIYRQYHF